MLKSFKHLFIAGGLLLAISSTSFAQTDFGGGTFGSTCFHNSAVVAVNGCLNKQEKARIKPHANIAQRKGDQLCLKIQNGKTKCLRTVDVDSFKHVRYFFLGVLPNQPIAAVYSLHYEWDQLNFISLVDGSEVYMKENIRDAVASPDGRHMVMTQANEMYDEAEAYVVEVFSVDATKPWESRFRANTAALKELQPLDAQWVSNDEVVVKLGTVDTEKQAGEIRVKFDGKKWQSTVKKY